MITYKRATIPPGANGVNVASAASTSAVISAMPSWNTGVSWEFKLGNSVSFDFGTNSPDSGTSSLLIKWSS